MKTIMILLLVLGVSNNALAFKCSGTAKEAVIGVAIAKGKASKGSAKCIPRSESDIQSIRITSMEVDYDQQTKTFYLHVISNVFAPCGSNWKVVFNDYSCSPKIVQNTYMDRI